MRRSIRWLYTLMIIAGTGLYVSLIFPDNIWLDEAFTVNILKFDFGQMMQYIIRDVHPPLYYIMLRGFLFGAQSLVLMRVFSIIPTLLMLLLGAFPIRKQFGHKVGLVFIAFVVLMPAMLHYTIEARMYSWAAFFVTASGVYAYKALCDKRVLNLVLMGVFMSAAAYTHYYSAVAVCILALFVFGFSFYKKRWLHVLVTGVFTAITCVPCVLLFLFQLGRIRDNYWIEPLTGDAVTTYWTYPFETGIAVLSVVMAVLFFGVIIWGFVTSKKDFESGFNLAFFGVFVLTIIAGIAASVAMRPFFIHRYMMVSTGLLALSGAYFVAKIKCKYMLHIALAICLVCGGLRYGVEFKNDYDTTYADMCGKIRQTLNYNTIFLHNNVHSKGIFTYYFPKNQSFLKSSTFEYRDEYFWSHDVDNRAKSFTLLKETYQDVWFVSVDMPKSAERNKIADGDKSGFLESLGYEILDRGEYYIPYSEYTIRLYHIKRSVFE